MISRIVRETAFPKNIVKLFSTSSYLQGIPKKNKLPPRPKWLIKEEELKETFLHGGSGAGGQKINKCNSKVQLTHIPTGIVVSCQYSRSKESNRKRAREILASKLDDLQNPETSRNAILVKRAQMVKQSKAKKSNRKYKKLEEEKLENEETTPEKPVVNAEDAFEQFLKSAKVDLSNFKK